MTTPFWIIIAMQGSLCLVFLFGDFGFDRPGRFGLDFDDLLGLLALQSLLGLTAASLAAAMRKWRHLCIELIVVSATFASVLIGDVVVD